MKTILICILVSHLLIIPCHAFDGFETIYPENDISHAKDMLPDEILPFVNSYDIKSGEGIKECLNRIKTHLAANLKNAVMSLWTPMITIFMVIILCSVIEPLFGGQTKSFPLTLFGCVEILYLTLSDSQTFFNDSITALKSLYDFSTVLLPCLAGTSVLAGATISSGVKYTAAALFMNLLLNFSNTILIPLISAYLIFVVGYAVFNQKLLSVLANFIRWGCKTALTVSTGLQFRQQPLDSGLIVSSEIFQSYSGNFFIGKRPDGFSVLDQCTVIHRVTSLLVILSDGSIPEKKGNFCDIITVQQKAANGKLRLRLFRIGRVMPGALPGLLRGRGWREQRPRGSPQWRRPWRSSLALRGWACRPPCLPGNSR